MKRCKLWGLFTLLFLGLSLTTFSQSGKSMVKITATIVDGDSSLIEKVEKDVYEALAENNYDHDIVFVSNSDIKSFPKKIILKPGEKQLFKFIAKDKNNIKLSYTLNGKEKEVKTYNDLYAKN